MEFIFGTVVIIFGITVILAFAWLVGFVADKLGLGK